MKALESALHGGDYPAKDLVLTEQENARILTHLANYKLMYVDCYIAMSQCEQLVFLPDTLEAKRPDTLKDKLENSVK